MGVTVTWLGHASFRIAGSAIIYIDPWKIADEPKDGDVILVSHPHQDHWSRKDIEKVSRHGAPLIGPPDVVESADEGSLLAPGGVIEAGGARITGWPAYNLRKPFHPRKKNWLGYIVELDGVSVYYAGDTDRIPEMADLEGIDLALLPAGGTFTMNPKKAAEAAGDIGALASLPYHWGTIVGSASDAESFAQIVGDRAIVLAKGDSTDIEPPGDFA